LSASVPPVLAVSGLSKKYSHSLGRGLAYAVRDIARELVPRGPAGLRGDEFWALDDVSFTVAPGDALAIVGRNGAGKSTLLKLLVGLLKPDRGEIRRRGRIEAIIELGTGFNPLLSGRENIAVGAALHGFSRAKARRLEDEVIAFAELEEAIDSPVQSYSTGMRARLSYALAAHMEPDLLLVDEVLTVGDFAFQRKCIVHMRAYLDGGGALLLVSHNVAEIQMVCNRALLLDRGRAIASGDPVEVLSNMLQQRGAAPVLDVPQHSDGITRIASLTVAGEGGEGLVTGRPAEIRLRYDTAEARDIMWTFSLWAADPWICVTAALERAPQRIEAGSGELVGRIVDLPLIAGRYLLHASIMDAEHGHAIVRYGDVHSGTVVDVASPPDVMGNIAMVRNQLVKIDVEWRRG
jgi:ABC-type polysaccharide/polyol phosphate transport system ATPase subunit